ncbi:Zinc carboxypeptidase [Granulicella pectinivorans]|uniref:Zinc carboxypeptidase n=1 Tax=Granulicella pectinivorans TaxID=474950 RepID=A0A1I6LTP1_9BACT|nr:M14 family zinc carboxypeptidase [Granulicella pectinivorans]SFS06776.1 Zinc carboxypeptidase [Granulicella pectinivorans]
MKLVPVLLACAISSPAFAQQAIAPHSGYQSQASQDAPALTASTKRSPAALLTTGEKTGWNETALYAEAVEISNKLAKASPLVKVITFGTTPEGRPMTALIVSKDKAFTPEAAAKTGKAIILIQSGIHSGEIEGKDTALMLIRDMVVVKNPEEASWLDKAIFVVIPVFNIDGHESRSPFNRAMQNGPAVTGLRNTMQDLNLNRDYLKGDTPEMRAWLRLYNAWLPDFMFDNHVTDGADYQYDVTWDMARNQDIAEPVRTWVNQTFVPGLNAGMAADGHLVSPYGALRRGASGNREFFMEVFSPRYSHLYTAVQNRPCLLVESHSLKTAKTRAWAHYDIMRDSIDTILKDPEALKKAVREADKAAIAAAGDRNAAPVYLGGEVDPTQSRPLTYLSLKSAMVPSEVTGATVNRFSTDKDDLTTVIHDQIKTTAEAKMPLGYLIPLAWKSLADELALHGVQMERTTKPIEQEFETYRFTDVKFAPRADEGHILVDYKLTPVKEKILFPAGSFYVPMKQRRARLILALLEPAAPDALARWGYIDAVFQSMGRIGAGDYLSVPIASRMMADNPTLRAEFETKLKADPTFAADPQARLTWWLSRSNYQKPTTNRYPVAQIWDKTW